MVSTQYPDTLIYNAAPVTDAVQDGTGDWVIPAVQTDKSEVPCRIEQNRAAGRFVVSADGQQQYISYTVYLPHSTADIPLGTLVDLVQGEVVLGQWAVKEVFRTRFNYQVSL